MRLKLLMVFISVSFLAYGEGRARAGVLAGIGSSSSTREITQSEGPYVSNYYLEYLLSSRVNIGVEHHRSWSLSPMATSVAFSGLTMKWYWPGHSPNQFYSSDSRPLQTYTTKIWSTYFGGSLGFAQSSLPRDSKGNFSTAAGLYGGASVGVDYAYWQAFGIRIEGVYKTILAGSGTLSTYGLMGGLYYYF